MTPQSLLAWGFIAVSLAVFADIDTTSEVAVAFAYLILVAVLFKSGAKVFGGFTAAIGAPTLGVGAGATGSPAGGENVQATGSV